MLSSGSRDQATKAAAEEGGGGLLGSEAKVYCQSVGSRKIPPVNMNKCPLAERQTLLLVQETEA